ncbi:MAG: 4Fe-4S cluster-binding domain-containing protein [Candidatus Aminicenantales bacterium]
MNIQEKIKSIEKALDRLSDQESDCRLCPRQCRVDRKKGEKGICQSGALASLSHALPHYGEEPVLSGWPDKAKEKNEDAVFPQGSGTIFFTGCNLKCLFCQNFQLSWLNEGHPVTDEELAAIMLGLQKKGALNINLVSPGHMILPILRALKMAYSDGLFLPLVWNSNGYEKTEIIQNLKGIVDIYLPDLKYFSSRVAGKFSGASDYFDHASSAVREMYGQRPGLILSTEDIAREGIIIRHLVLPGHIRDSLALLRWMARNLSPSVCLSLMSQYHPCFKAPQEIQKPLSPKEYALVLAEAKKLGFENLFIQPESFGPEEHLVPDFSRPEPFRWK